MPSPTEHTINDMILPSALDHIHEILPSQEEQEKNNIAFAIFLDYDGTLTPIVSTPSEAILSEGARNAVRNLSHKYITAIVSGRGKEEVKKMVNVPTLYYAGSHGFEIEGPDNLKHIVAEKDIPKLQQIYQALVERVGKIPGCIVENKLLTLSVHYRNIPTQEQISEVENAVKDEVSKFSNEVKMTYGKKVFEIRPRVEWDKGKAVLLLLQELSRKFPQRQLMGIFLGDDATDEDAFRVLRETGKGVGILVSEDDEKQAGSYAKYSLRNTTEVETFLNSLSTIEPAFGLPLSSAV